jgi:hypothetical protein
MACSCNGQWLRRAPQRLYATHMSEERTIAMLIVLPISVVVFLCSTDRYGRFDDLVRDIDREW